jgi:hypothetical protein
MVLALDAMPRGDEYGLPAEGAVVDNCAMKTRSPFVSFHFLFAMVSCALLGAAASFAQAPAIPNSAPGATPAAKPKLLPATDQMYLRTSLASLYYLVQLTNAGKAITDEGLSRLRDTSVKDLGKAYDALGKIAVVHGEKMPTDVSMTQKSDLDRVTKAKPDKLPKEWADAVAKETKRLDHDTSTAEKSVQDPDLKTFITNYGPTIRSAFTAAEAADKAQKKAK